MDNTNEITDSAGARPPGVLSKLGAGAAGIAAGAAGYVLAINALITKNIRKAAQPGFDRLEKMIHAAEAPAYDADPEQVFKNAQRNAREMFTSAIRARDNDSNPIRNELALKRSKLSMRFKATDAAVTLDPAPIRQNIRNAYEQISGQHGFITPEVEQDMLRNIEALTIEGEKKRFEQVLRELLRHIPLKERVLLSPELHLSGGQKAVAGLAFAGAAAVAAGAFYYGMKHHAKTAQEKQAQRQAQAIPL